MLRILLHNFYFQAEKLVRQIAYRRMPVLLNNDNNEKALFVSKAEVNLLLQVGIRITIISYIKQFRH